MVLCHGDSRDRDFSTLMPVGRPLTAVVRAEDPTDALKAVFGSSVLPETTVAVMRNLCSYRARLLLLSSSATSSIDFEEKHHGDTCQEVPWEITEREA